MDDFYVQQLQKLKEIALTKCNRDSFITNAIHGNISNEILTKYLSDCNIHKGECDFHIIKLIRILYLGDDQNEVMLNTKNNIYNTLKKFPFWPNETNKNTDQIVFWSENHILMMLSSFYLLKQWGRLQNNNIDTQYDIINTLNNDLESKLLIKYLEGHVSKQFQGVYEVNSHVYLPYTLSALLNIYDFSLDIRLKKFSHQLIDIIIYHVLLCTTPNNSVFLAASARAFLRTRQRNFGHNINQLINVLNYTEHCKKNDELNTTALTDFLITSTWRPNRYIEDKSNLTQATTTISTTNEDDDVKAITSSTTTPATTIDKVLSNQHNAVQALYWDGFQRIQINHKTEVIKEIYSTNLMPSKDNNTTATTTSNNNNNNNNIHTELEDHIALLSDVHLRLSNEDNKLKEYGDLNISNQEFIPFYWSAGLITHPYIVSDTRKYQQLKKLNKNKHLWYLSYFSPNTLHYIMDSYELLSSGQVYTGITLNVYKKPLSNLCMTSFEQYNPHKAGFQQLPWIANIAGLPIWTQSGLGKKNKASGVAGFGITNTHNPWISQQGSLLIACYAAPKKLTSSILKRLFTYESQLFWPEILFEQSVVYSHSQVRISMKYSKMKTSSLLSSLYHCTSNSTTTTSNNHSIKKKNTLDSPELVNDELFYSSLHDLNEIEAYHWCVSSKDQCYIAMLCTEPIEILRYNNTNHNTSTKNSKDYQPGKDSFDYIEVKKDSKSKDKDIIPMTRFYCTSIEHTWIIIVGTHSEYHSIENFYQERLSKLRISDNHNYHTNDNTTTISNTTSNRTMFSRISSSSSNKKNTYMISIQDPIEGDIDYIATNNL